MMKEIPINILLEWVGRKTREETHNTRNVRIFCHMFKMKLFWLLVFAFFGAVVCQMEKDEAVAQCITELAIDEGLKLREYFKDQGELPEDSDKNAKCVFFCVSKKVGWTDESGSIDKDKVISYISEKYPDLEKNQFEPVVTLCAERSETDPCEKWYEFVKCQTKAYLEYKKNKN